MRLSPPELDTATTATTIHNAKTITVLSINPGKIHIAILSTVEHSKKLVHIHF